MRILSALTRCQIVAPLLLLPFIVKVRAQGAEACGVCHQDLHKEWLQSRHSQAWKSESFQAQMKSFGSPEFCGRCHAPRSVWQQVELELKTDVALSESTRPDTKSFQEVLAKDLTARTVDLEDGVSCNSCHYVEVLWPGGKSDEVLGPYHSEVSHTGKQSTLFQSFALCGSCHGRDPQLYRPEKAGGAGYHHARNQPITFASGADSDCGSCHMPPRQQTLVQLRVFKNLEERRVGQHTFAGRRYAALEDALQFSIQDQVLTVTNRGVGHALQISADTQYLLQIQSGGSTQEVMLDGARSLEPGQSLTIPLEVSGGKWQIDFFHLDLNDFKEKLFSRTLE